MCMAPRVPAAPAPRNVLQVYGRTLDLDKEADRLDYETLQRREAAGLIDRWGRDIAPPEPAPSTADADAGTAAQAGSVAQKAEPPAAASRRPVGEDEKQARRRTASQARVAGRAPAIGAGSRLGQGNSAKKTLLGG